MSAFDPLAAIAQQVVAAADAAVFEATFTLGEGEQRIPLAVGQIVEAVVLPPRDGHDAIEVFARTVPAQLPPNVRPGDPLRLQVTALRGSQIIVRTIEAPQAAAAVKAPTSPSAAVFVAASVRPPATRAAAGSALPIAAAQTSKPTAPRFAGAAGSSARTLDARIAAAQTKTRVTQPSTIAPSVVVRAQGRQAVQSVVQHAARTVGDLLRSLRVPDTPVTRIAAAIAPRAAEKLPAVLARLAQALPEHSVDSRIDTLKTLIAFTATLDPSNEETLAAQISAYVSNAVEGAEPKVAQLLHALAHTSAQPPVLSLQAHARAAERTFAVQHDLKTLVLSLLREPRTARAPELTRALNETVITLTGTQLNALASNEQAGSPNAVALSLPLFYREGGKPAHIRISGDPNQGGAQVDGDNFHIAFVLDTAHLGMVSIDLQTAGRIVNVDVRTERQPAASMFAKSLSALRDRLESLRYRVNSAKAAALPARAVRAPAIRAPRSTEVDSLA